MYIYFWNKITYFSIFVIILVTVKMQTLLETGHLANTCYFSFIIYTNYFTTVTQNGFSNPNCANLSARACKNISK